MAPMKPVAQAATSLSMIEARRRRCRATLSSNGISIAAPRVELLGVDGMGEAGVSALKVVQAAALRLARAEVLGRPVITLFAPRSHAAFRARPVRVHESGSRPPMPQVAELTGDRYRFRVYWKTPVRIVKLDRNMG